MSLVLRLKILTSRYVNSPTNVNPLLTLFKGWDLLSISASKTALTSATHIRRAVIPSASSAGQNKEAKQGGRPRPNKKGAKLRKF